jgi:hypothetical protein
MSDAIATIRAPWTDAQVMALNTYQADNRFHEFTCPNDHAFWRSGPADTTRRTLLATTDGWLCLTCGYRQDWAHAFMAEPLP